MDLVRKYTSGATGEATAKGVPAWLSVPVVDRSGDFIDGSDMDLSQYLVNPVVLWCHRNQDPPIGRMPDLAAKAYASGFSGLYGTVEFDAGDEFACKVRDKYHAGYIRGLSVGFVPAGWRDLTAAERERVGYKGTRARRMTKGRLLEASCVPVPDNQLALSVVMKHFGDRIPDDLKAAIADLTPPQTTFAADLSKIRGVGSPAPADTPPVTTKGTGMADQPNATAATPAPADAGEHEVQLGDESAVLFKAVQDLTQKLTERDAADAEFKTAYVKGLEDGLNAILAKQEAVTAELAKVQEWTTKAEEFFGEQAKAIAGLYERKGR